MLISDTQLQQQVTVEIPRNDSEHLMALNNDHKVQELSNGLLFARPLSKEAEMAFTASGKEGECQYQAFSAIRQPIILTTQDKMTLNFSGEWSIEILSLSQVSTLFSFLDFQAQFRHGSSENDKAIEESGVLMQEERNLALFIGAEKKTFIALVISTLLNPEDRRLECLFSFIRNIESYWIAHFLLTQVMNEDKESDGHKICNASKIYGVSESYFRKLCHHAFTRGPKKQLRLWRAAHSALQLIEKDNSIANIAGNNGYASSSHFSSEIKSLFGITPREFKKLEGLLNE